MKTINNLANTHQTAKRAYVYSGFSQPNNYIRGRAAHRASPQLTPINTGKVLIGSAYQPSLNGYSADQEWLQDVLLNQPKPAPKQLSDIVLWWLYGAAIVVIALTF